jgi:hypothetical protein
MDARELARLYDEGVRFECGCEEKGLHPSVRKALLDGSVSTVELLYCPVHWAPMVGAPQEPLPHVDPLVFE